MTEQALLLRQRSTGQIDIRLGRHGVEVLREEGCSKLRLPVGSHEAILINTSGGLAGGDAISIRAEAASSHLTLTSQAAERVYRTLSPPASVHTHLKAADGASLFWLPHETILFDGAALARTFEVALAGDARFLAAEAIVLGRPAMGEKVQQVEVVDNWRISRDGKLIHADALRLSGPPPASAATLNGAGAFATVIYCAKDSGEKLDAARNALGACGGVSSWNGKMLARLTAGDGYSLRKALIPLLSVLTGAEGVPKVWSF